MKIFSSNDSQFIRYPKQSEIPITLLHHILFAMRLRPVNSVPLKKKKINNKGPNNFHTIISLAFYVWSVFPAIHCGLQGNKAYCETCDSLVAAQVLGSSKLVWVWIITNCFDVSWCVHMHEKRKWEVRCQGAAGNPLNHADTGIPPEVRERCSALGTAIWKPVQEQAQMDTSGLNTHECLNPDAEKPEKHCSCSKRWTEGVKQPRKLLSPGNTMMRKKLTRKFSLSLWEQQCIHVLLSPSKESTGTAYKWRQKVNIYQPDSLSVRRILRWRWFLHVLYTKGNSLLLHIIRRYSMTSQR